MQWISDKNMEEQDRMADRIFEENKRKFEEERGMYLRYLINKVELLYGPTK